MSHIRHLQEHEGVTDFKTAVVQGATERLVPILTTALAAFGRPVSARFASGAG